MRHKVALVLSALFAFYLLFGTVSAGTVTLTGTCQNLIRNNTLQFGLSNSGNDSAFTMLLTPMLKGAKSVGNYTIPSLGPNGNDTLLIRLSNVTAKGTYTDYILVSYQQGGTYFTSSFPCLLDFGNHTTSQLYVNTNQTFVGKLLKVNVTVFNGASGSITANLSLIMPPGIALSSNAVESITVYNFSKAQATFLISPPSGSQSYSAAAVVDYEKQGLHYSSFSIFTISGPTSGGRYSLIVIALAGFGAVIVLVIALILFAAVRKKKQGKAEKPKSN